MAFQDIMSLAPDTFLEGHPQHSSPKSSGEEIIGAITLTSAEFNSINKFSLPWISEMSANNFSYDRNKAFGSEERNNIRNSGTSDYSPADTEGRTRPMSGFSTPPNRSGGFNEGNVPLSAVIPGPVYPSDAQLGVAYGYAIRRENGTFTRLIRADELEALEGVPKSQGPEGLIILPPTRQLSPRRRAGPDPMISGMVLQASPPINGPRRTIPPSQDSDMTQMQIDTIVQRNAVSSSAISTPARPQRREKIYCDKWIHEGVCAFTQLGCKYLHEMPMDKATQVALGLNHGLPAWYRRANTVDLRPAAPAAPTPTNATRTDGPWRKIGSSSSPSIPSGGRGFGSNFGPIAPPRQSAVSSRPPPSNPFAMLQCDSHNGEDEDEEPLTWQGRGR